MLTLEREKLANVSIITCKSEAETTSQKNTPLLRLSSNKAGLGLHCANSLELSGNVHRINLRLATCVAFRA